MINQVSVPNFVKFTKMTIASVCDVADNFMILYHYYHVFSCFNLRVNCGDVAVGVASNLPAGYLSARSMGLGKVRVNMCYLFGILISTIFNPILQAQKMGVFSLIHSQPLLRCHKWTFEANYSGCALYQWKGNTVLRLLFKDDIHRFC